MDIVGVTGTSGKTSCTHLIAQALHHLGKPAGIIGTIGYGEYGSLAPARLTTPDATELQTIFLDLFDKNIQYVAMEVSSHGLVQKRIRDVSFKIGIFTNLTHDHLDYHLTMEAYGAAKQTFFTDYAMEHALINQDDAFGRQLIATLSPRKSVLTYGLDTQYIQDISATHINEDRGMRAKVKTPWGEGALFSPLLGRFNLSNALVVLGSLCLLDIPFDDALKSLCHLTPVSGRMEVLGGGDEPSVVIDYSHKPDALQSVLKALRSTCRGKLYCIVGCGGDRDKQKRPMMARIAEQFADCVVVTSDNPRTEDPGAIIEEMMAGFDHPLRVITEADRAKAIAEAIQHAQSGDVVLIAGKGAEVYQEIGNQKIPFSDHTHAKRALENR